MNRTETTLTNALNATNATGLRSGDRVLRISTGNGYRYCWTDRGGNDVRLVLGATMTEAKAAISSLRD